MQLWDYLRIYHYPYDGTYQLNGKDHRPWKGQRVDVVLNTLGDEGWELVSTVGNVDSGLTGTSTTSYYFFFKRPKSG